MNASPHTSPQASAQAAQPDAASQTTQPAHAAQPDAAKKPRAHRIRKVVAIVAAVVVALAIVAFAVYVNGYSRADATALEAMQSNDQVQVERTVQGQIVFTPRSADPQAGIVFYPGGLVQAEAYAPLMQDLAARGFLCVVTPMPYNLAVFDINAADGIQQQFPDVHEWVLMGHSLGGAMAATYAADHPGQWQGLVLLGAYSTADLTHQDIQVLCISGTEDLVLNRKAALDNVANLPLGYTEIDLPGGNHGQFGSYGAQAGDGTATLTPQQQWQLTAQAVAQTFLPGGEAGASAAAGGGAASGGEAGASAASGGGAASDGDAGVDVAAEAAADAQAGQAGASPHAKAAEAA